MTSVTSISSNHESQHEAITSSELPAMRRENFYTLNDQGDVTQVGCELLLGINDPRGYLEKYGLKAKALALKAGIEAARGIPDELVSINIDGDLATPEFIWQFEDFKNLPKNVVFELTEVKQIPQDSLLLLTAIAIKNNLILIDDMPTIESIHNLKTLLGIIENIDINYGIKIDFKTTHALLGRSRTNNVQDDYEKALLELELIKDLLAQTTKKPNLIIFEGLHYEDELERVTNEFAPLLDISEDKDQKPAVLGQFFKNEIKGR